MQSLPFIVAPTETYFEHYRTNAPIEVNEDSPLNVTCVGKNARPEVAIRFYVGGKLIEDGIHRWAEQNKNGTKTSYAALYWRPT